MRFDVLGIFIKDGFFSIDSVGVGFLNVVM